MKKIDLDSAINVLETYMMKCSGRADYLKDVISELKNVYDEMDRYNRENAKITILPWNED